MADVNTDDLTRRMIDEGARILAEQGPAGLTLRKLAAVCGTSTMAVYTRFGDKPRLLAAMHREGFARLGARLRVTAADPLASLTELGRAYRVAALDSRHLYGLMFGTLPPEVTLDEEDDKAAAATYSTLVEGVRRAVAAEVLVGDPERIALHLWVVAHGMVGLELSGQLPVPAEQTARVYDEALAFAAKPFLPSP
ncbi:MAG TPA: TetR/AcrR family transcriptional regulator [Nocardioidaceae bacterium]|nr:TetR/AcrR family transcriptional regulator [Nocardioidaceae bacterium]